jgi:hypothetical protein
MLKEYWTMVVGVKMRERDLGLTSFLVYPPSISYISLQGVKYLDALPRRMVRTLYHAAPCCQKCLSEAESVKRHILGVPTQYNPEHTYAQLEQRIV